MSAVFTPKSRIKEVYADPVGRDVIDKILLQLGLGAGYVTNPLVANLRLGALPKLAGKAVDAGFVQAVCNLLNLSKDEDYTPYLGPVEPQWWKQAVVYQIYPHSFMDSNGDGIGDLRGIIQKLPYLKELGVDVIWLSPIYDSPCDDNGYDIRDYKQILRDFGTMEDFDELLARAGESSIKIIMDLVINHTSDEHEWFKSASADPDSPYREFYIGAEKPNNWTSFFSGPAWSHYPGAGRYYLHLFTKKQMDLNWDNPAVREQLYEMINWWLQKGIAGFRLDVINYISKTPLLPDGNERIGEMMGFTGIEHYFYGPNLHRYLRELRQRTFGRLGAFAVGETPGVGLEMSKRLTGQSRGELDMVFSFDHLENPGKTRFDDYVYELAPLKKALLKWQTGLDNGCWPSLFFNNHDNPFMLGKIAPALEHRDRIAKLLAMLLFTLRGTPFIYQGEELGRVNTRFDSIDELRDVESKNFYEKLISQGQSPQQAFAAVLALSRDHARTPMPWTAEGGFTTAAEAWIKQSGDCKTYNAQDQSKDENSVFNFYRTLIALRKADPTLVYGEILPQRGEDGLFCYHRVYAGGRYYVEINLENKTNHAARPGGELILSNYSAPGAKLRPYEANLYRFDG